MRFQQLLLAFAMILALSHADGAWAQQATTITVTGKPYASESISSVAYSSDGSRVLSVAGNRVMVSDAGTGALVRSFHLPKHETVNSPVAFSPDGLRVASPDTNKKLKLWDATTGAPLLAFEGDCTCERTMFSPSGSRVLSDGGEDKRLKLWDAVNGALLLTFDASSAGGPAAFSPDGSRVLSPSGYFGNHTLALWDATTGLLLRTLDGHSRVVASVAFSPDGSRVLSGSYDMTLKLWDVATGALLHTFKGHSQIVTSVVFSSDGLRVLSGSNDNTMKLWDAVSGSLLRTFEGDSFRQHPNTWVNSVAFSPDGSRVISGGSDGALRIWKAQTGQILVRMMVVRDGTWMMNWEALKSEWLTITSQGFFSASPKGTQFVDINRGFEIINVGQVHQSLYNPDLVRETLLGDPNGEVREAAKLVNLEKVVDSGPPPDVEIISHSDANRTPIPETSQSRSDVVTFQVRITDRGKGVGRIEWRVNGITAGVAAKPDGVGPTYTMSRQLALDPGDNVIDVVAYSGSNLIASRSALTLVKFTGPADKTKPKLHILAIGINAYVDRGWAPPGNDTVAFGKLGLAVKDAKAFAESMKKAAAGLYKEIVVTEALDKDATRDNLSKIVDKVAAQIHPRDSFILFAAAHGGAENGRFYLIPQEYQSGPPGTLARTAIGQDQLQDWLANRIKAKKAIILLDTCESGALIAGHARSRIGGPASDATVGRLHEATGRPVLTAAAAGQFAHEGLIDATGERHGVFTWAVLDALRNADTNGNGLIELSELVVHVQNAVPKIAEAMGGAGRAAISEPVWGKQVPRFGSRGEDFVVARRLH